jgi:hypothetical protein
MLGMDASTSPVFLFFHTSEFLDLRKGVNRTWHVYPIST